MASSLHAAQVTGYGVWKGHHFYQLPFPGSVPGEWTEPYRLEALAEASPGATFSRAALKVPTGSTRNLVFAGNRAALMVKFDRAAELEAQFPAAADYALELALTGANVQTVTTPLEVMGAPPTPFLLGLENLNTQHEVGRPFRLRWEPLANPAAGDTIQVVITHVSQLETYRSPGPGEAGVLPATATELLVPGAAWEIPEATGDLPMFTVQVICQRTAWIDSTTIPGAVGVGGAFTSTTATVELVVPQAQKDITDFGVFGGRVFVQSGPDTAVVSTDASLRFEAGAEGRTADTLTKARLTLPGGRNVELVRDAGGTGFWLRTVAATAMEFDALYPPGAHMFALETSHEGSLEVVVDVPREVADFPAPALLLNYTKAQALDPARAITLEATSWDAETGDDFVQLILTTVDGTVVEATTPWPGRIHGGSLDLEADRLDYGQTYLARIRRFRVTVHDTDSYPGGHGWAGRFTETVCTIQTVPAPDAMTIVSPAKETLPVGVEWIRWLEVEGGQAPLTWTVVQGAPPKGLELDLAKGRFRGWPAASGTSNLHLRVTDAAGRVAEQDLVFEVTGVAKWLWVAPTNLPTALGDGYYFAELASGGGVLPVRWTLAPGSGPLPPGLVLESDHGIIHGVPQSPGSYPFVARAVDGSGQLADRALAIEVPAFEPDPELSITGTEITPAGQLRVLGTVAAGSLCTLEGSTDLQEWASLVTGANLDTSGLELPVPSSDRPVFLRVRRGPAEPPLRPMSATLVRDTNAVTVVVLDSAGGSLSLTNSAGTVMTLTIPTNALIEPTEVRMTLLLGLDGAPLSEGWIGGVHLEPEGLVLRQPATLTIRSTTALGKNVVALAYEAEGFDLHDEPMSLSDQALRISVMHFSGYGAGKPGPIDWERISKSMGGSCRASSRAQSKISALLRAAAANPDSGGVIPPTTMAALDGAFLEWWNETVLPYVDAAKRDDAILNQAVNEYLVWAKSLELLLEGLGSSTNRTDFEPLRSRWRAKAACGALNALNKIHVKAVTEHVFSSAPTRMWGIGKDAYFLDLAQELPGRLDEAAIFDRINRIWRFELSMDADVSAVGPEGSVAFSVAMEGGVIDLASAPEGVNMPMDFGAGYSLNDFWSYPLQRKHFKATAKKGKPWRSVKTVGALQFHHLTFGRESKSDSGSSDPGDSGGCPRQHFKRTREPTPPDQLTLFLSFNDPARAVIPGAPAVDLLVQALKGFHRDEILRKPDEDSLDLFGFRQKWVFTWREVVAQADYNPPPATGVGGGEVVETANFTLKHKPKPLRKSDQEVPPEP